jgi:DNA-directed RNA polymerase subunit RPC12/RpoP
MNWRCPYCNSAMTLLRPNREEIEALAQCEGCGRIFELDSQPSAPANLPGREERVDLSLPLSN